MKTQTSQKGKKKRTPCINCNNKDAVIKKYGLYLCRRCFKENAIIIGFKKYD
jgi:small subunit ribosomal protein S14